MKITDILRSQIVKSVGLYTYDSESNIFFVISLLLNNYAYINDKIKHKFAKKMFTQCYLRVENMLILVNLSLGRLIIELYPGPTVTLSEFKINIWENLYIWLTRNTHKICSYLTFSTIQARNSLISPAIGEFIWLVSSITWFATLETIFFTSFTFINFFALEITSLYCFEIYRYK